MPRFWTSFYADDPRSINGNPGHTFFRTGFRDTEDNKLCYTMCVLVEAPDVATVWATLRSPDFYPEAQERFIQPAEDEWNPNSGGRFPRLHLWETATPLQQGQLIGVPGFEGEKPIAVNS